MDGPFAGENGILVWCGIQQQTWGMIAVGDGSESVLMLSLSFAPFFVQFVYLVSSPPVSKIWHAPATIGAGCFLLPSKDRGANSPISRFDSRRPEVSGIHLVGASLYNLAWAFLPLSNVNPKSRHRHVLPQ